MAITLTLLILAAALGSRMAMVNYWHRKEMYAFDEGKFISVERGRRRWHFWLGVSFYIMLGSMVCFVSYDYENFKQTAERVSWWWKIGDVTMYAAACWVAFTVTINVKQGSTWHHVGTGNKTDDTIGKVAGWLGRKLTNVARWFKKDAEVKLKPTTLNGIIIVLLGLAAISRVVFVYLK